jgi:hypothetical protein
MIDEAYLGYGMNLRIHSPMFDPSLSGRHMDNICLGRVYTCHAGEPSGDPYVSKTPFNTSDIVDQNHDNGETNSFFDIRYDADYVYANHDNALAAVQALDVSAEGTGCSSITITDMVQKFGDAAIMAYSRAHHKDIQVDMRLTDCETETDGGYDKENSLEFVLRNMDDCEVHEYNAKQVVKGFLNMVHDYGGFLMNFKPKLIAKICKYQKKLIDKSMSDSPELRTVKMKLCNMDSLACPRDTFYAQNSGCNTRPMFGVAEVYSVANGDETMLYQVNFGERGIKISASFGFVSGGLEKMLKSWVPGATAAAVGATMTSGISSAAGNAVTAEHSNHARLAAEGVGKVAQLLTDFKFAVTLKKGRGSGNADGTNFWSFDIDLVSLKDIPGLKALFISYLAKGNHHMWTKFIAFAGGHFYMFGQDLGEMGGIESSDSQDQAVSSALRATATMMNVIQKYFSKTVSNGVGESPPLPRVDPCLPERVRLAKQARMDHVIKTLGKK